MSVPAFLTAVHGRSADGARAALSQRFAGKANGKPLDIEAQVRLLESFWLGFPDGSFTMEPTGGSGRHVITWTFSGTHDGVYLGVPPTGKPVAFSGFIICVSDATGIVSLDWKWDTKVFTKAVLGPDDVGELVVKDNFRDPSARWNQDGRRPGAPKGKGRGSKPQGQRQPGQPRQVLGPDGKPLPQQPRAPRPVLGPDGQPVLGPDGQPLMHSGKRRRRGKGKGPRTDAPNDPPMTPSAPMPEAGGDPSPSASSAPSADAASGTKPDGT